MDFPRRPFRTDTQIWSPMPNVMFAREQTEAEKHSPLQCEECGMNFRSRKFLKHHQEEGFCCGNVEEDVSDFALKLISEKGLKSKEKEYENPDTSELVPNVRITVEDEDTDTMKTVPGEDSEALKPDNEGGSQTELKDERKSVVNPSGSNESEGLTAMVAKMLYDGLYKEQEEENDIMTYPKLRWVRCFNGKVPEFAVKAGHDFSTNSDIYVCRADVEGERIPGKVIPADQCAYVAARGSVVKVKEYEALTDPNELLTWKQSEVPGGIPRGAQKGGYDSKQLMYFVARATAPDGCPTCGKYIPQEIKCVYTWRDQEHSSMKCEFLCKK